MMASLIRSCVTIRLAISVLSGYALASCQPILLSMFAGLYTRKPDFITRIIRSKVILR